MLTRRYALPAAALSLALLCPTVARAGYPTYSDYWGEDDGNGNTIATGYTCTIPNVPLYNQIDPNLAYIEVPQATQTYEENNYTGSYATWPKSGPNEGLFSKSWVKSGPMGPYKNWNTTGDPGHIINGEAASDSCGFVAEAMALQGALANRTTYRQPLYFQGRQVGSILLPFTTVSPGWLADFAAGTAFGWDGNTSGCAVANGFTTTCPTYWSDATQMTPFGLAQVVDMQILGNQVPSMGWEACIAPSCGIHWPHYLSFSPFVQAYAGSGVAPTPANELVGPGASCSSPGDCGSGNTCVHGTCAAVCNASTPCASGYCMTYGSARPPSGDGACLFANYETISAAGGGGVLCSDDPTSCECNKSCGRWISITNQHVKDVIDQGGEGIYHKSWWTATLGADGTSIGFEPKTQSHYLALAGYSATFDGEGDMTSMSIKSNNPSYGTQGNVNFIDVSNGTACPGATVNLGPLYQTLMAWPCVNCGEGACTAAGCTDTDPNGLPGRAISSICDVQPGDEVMFIDELYSIYVY